MKIDKVTPDGIVRASNLDVGNTLLTISRSIGLTMDCTVPGANIGEAVYLGQNGDVVSLETLNAQKGIHHGYRIGYKLTDDSIVIDTHYQGKRQR